MTKKNNEIRRALENPDYRMGHELEIQVDDEVEALLTGFDCYSVPFDKEGGPIVRPDFLSAAVEALAECEALPEAVLIYYTEVNRDGRGDWAYVAEIIEPVLEAVARRMILRAWLGGEDD